MPIYVYRTYPPVGSGQEPREFEIDQSIHENTLVTDPQTGHPVKRVIRGGYVYLPPSGGSQAGRNGCCGGGCGCHS